jgi:hypothetical protein
MSISRQRVIPQIFSGAGIVPSFTRRQIVDRLQLSAAPTSFTVINLSFIALTPVFQQ